MSITVKFDFRKYYEFIKENITSKVNILHIFLMTLALHFFCISTPDTGMIFDESHYIPAAIATLQGTAANAEHTPLAKLVLGWSIGLFGNWWFGWRITPVIFGSLSIVLVYFIAKHFMSRKYALFASAFIMLDVLFFVNNSIAILDPQALFFALCGVALLLKAKDLKGYGWSALAFGIAVLSNEIALLIVGGMGLYLLLKNLRGIKIRKPHFKAFKPFVVFFLLFTVVVVGGVWIYDVVYKPTSESVLQTNVAATVYVNGNGSAVTTSYVTTNVTSHIYITNPLQHFLFAFNYYKSLVPAIQTSAQNFRPPWSWVYPLVNAGNPPLYYGVTVSVGSVVTQTIAYRSQISYPVTVFLVPTLVLCFWFLLKKRKDDFPLFYLGWFAVTYVPWLLLGTFVQRMTFNYYFLYTTPIMDIGAPWFISQLKVSERWKNGCLLCLLLILGVYFLYYFPINLFRA